MVEGRADLACFAFAVSSAGFGDVDLVERVFVSDGHEF